MCHGTRFHPAQNDTFYIVVFGLVHSLLFMFAIKENELVHKKEHYMQVQNAIQHRPEQLECSEVQSRPMDNYGLLDWFKDATFYKIVRPSGAFRAPGTTRHTLTAISLQSFIYMVARLYLNLPCTYIVLYLPETLFLHKVIAIVSIQFHISTFTADNKGNYQIELSVCDWLFFLGIV